MSNHAEFEKKAKTHLDKSLDDLTPDISRRLQQARFAALEKAKPRRLWSFFPQAATAAFAVVVLSVGIFFNLNQNEELDTIAAMETEIEMLSSNENIELMEDLEFIQWLVETNEYAS